MLIYLNYYAACNLYFSLSFNFKALNVKRRATRSVLHARDVRENPYPYPYRPATHIACVASAEIN